MGPFYTMSASAANISTVICFLFISVSLHGRWLEILQYTLALDVVAMEQAEVQITAVANRVCCDNYEEKLRHKSFLNENSRGNARTMECSYRDKVYK